MSELAQDKANEYNQCAERFATVAILLLSTYNLALSCLLVITKHLALAFVFQMLLIGCFADYYLFHRHFGRKRDVLVLGHESRDRSTTTDACAVNLLDWLRLVFLICAVFYLPRVSVAVTVVVAIGGWAPFCVRMMAGGILKRRELLPSFVSIFDHCCCLEGLCNKRRVLLSSPSSDYGATYTPYQRSEDEDDDDDAVRDEIAQTTASPPQPASKAVWFRNPLCR